MFSINLKFKPIWKSQNRQEGGSGGPLCCGAGVRAESPGGGGPDLDRVEVMVDKKKYFKTKREPWWWWTRSRQGRGDC